MAPDPTAFPLAPGFLRAEAPVHGPTHDIHSRSPALCIFSQSYTISLLATPSCTNCIKRFSVWMFTNRLKLNMDKTEFIIFGTRQQLWFYLCPKRNNLFTPSCSQFRRPSWPRAQNEVSCSHILQTSYMHIRKLRSLRKYITQESMKTLVHFLIISRINYCNSLLYGISEESLDKLHRVQNAAARLIFGLRKYDNISKYLIKLHWLPVRWRIKYKIALITYKP